MKKSVKKLLFFALFLIIISPLSVYAVSNETSYISMGDATSLSVGDLYFDDISFKDNSDTSSLSFGIHAFVTNNSSSSIYFTSTVYYYDDNYNLIASANNTYKAVPNYLTAINQMSNSTILNNYSTDDIFYYKIYINIDSNSTLSSSSSKNLTPSKNSEYSSYDYVIDKYDINIIVNENNTFDITETITAYFNIEKHGIYRTIPLSNTVTRLDGTTTNNKTQVTNVSVDNEYKTSKEYGNYKIKIGSSSTTLKGEQKYVIKYTYNLGKDPINSYDELYYNIIGTEWDTVMGNITFTIIMPKDFDASKLGFSSGKAGSTDNSNITYEVRDNTISGSYDGILGIGEALTVRCELDEGYFVGAGLQINYFDYVLYLIPILFLAISILIWYKFGRDDMAVETVEFYPPEGLNSLEVGFFYKGSANNRDVTSLLVYLANKGYVKIVDANTEAEINEEKNIDTQYDYQSYGEKTSTKKFNILNNFFKKDKYKIVKIREYDGDNKFEQWFMDGLFPNWVTEATETTLYDKFYVTLEKILSNINDKEYINKIFEKSASKKKKFINLMIFATYCLITIPPFLEYDSVGSIILAVLFPCFGFTYLFQALIGDCGGTIYINGKATSSSIALRIFGIQCGLIFGGIPWLGLVLPVLIQDKFYLIGYLIGLVCVFGMVICKKYLPKRTPFGTDILGKLKGFKNFLETAEKEKLEAMVLQNPTYFYDILPYTYVLGVSNKWIKKFESISMEAPSWYDSSNTFDMVSFGSFIDKTMSSAESVMASSPSSSSGGDSSSSGGGSSGGGSGGGGGGSW